MRPFWKVISLPFQFNSNSQILMIMFCNKFALGNTRCFDVKLITKTYAYENSWTLGTCQSKGGYANNNEYVEKCCLSPGSYILECKDSHGDGWHMGYIELDGSKYCESFTDGKKEINEITFEDTGIYKSNFTELNKIVSL